MNLLDFYVTNNEVSQFAKVAQGHEESGNILDLSSSDTLRSNSVIRKVALTISELLRGYIVPQIYMKDAIQVLQLSPGWVIKFDQTGHENDLCGTVESYRPKEYKRIAQKHKNRENLLRAMIGDEYVMPEYWFCHNIHKESMPYRVTRSVSVRGKPVNKSNIAPGYFTEEHDTEGKEEIQDIVHLYNLEEIIRGYSLQKLETMNPKLFRFLSALQSGLKKLQEEKKIYVDLTFRHNIAVIWRNNRILGFRIYDTGTFFYDLANRPDFIEVTQPLGVCPVDAIHPNRVEAVGILYEFLGITYCQATSR